MAISTAKGNIAARVKARFADGGELASLVRSSLQCMSSGGVPDLVRTMDRDILRAVMSTFADREIVEVPVLEIVAEWKIRIKAKEVARCLSDEFSLDLESGTVLRVMEAGFGKAGIFSLDEMRGEIATEADLLRTANVFEWTGRSWKGRGV